MIENIELAKTALAAARKHYEERRGQFSMGVWFAPGWHDPSWKNATSVSDSPLTDEPRYEFDCGMTACLGGHIMIAAGYKVAVQVDSAGGNYDVLRPDGRGAVRELCRETEQLLGMSRDDSYGPYDDAHPNGWEEPVWYCDREDIALERFAAMIAEAEAAQV